MTGVFDNDVRVEMTHDSSDDAIRSRKIVPSRQYINTLNISNIKCRAIGTDLCALPTAISKPISPTGLMTTDAIRSVTPTYTYGQGNRSERGATIEERDERRREEK